MGDGMFLEDSEAIAQIAEPNIHMFIFSCV